MDVIVQLIQTLGFPIAVCVFLAYYIKKQNEQYREDVKQITDKYETAIANFSECLDKNTQVLTRLEARLKGVEEDA